MTTSTAQPTPVDPDPRSRKQVPHNVKTSRRAAWIFAPSLLVSFLFVYVFIGITAYISLSNWKIGTSPNLSVRQPLGATYGELVQEQRFQADIRNVVIFTVIFLVLAILGGLVAALFIHHVAVGKGLFRTVFLLPYALSFIVTGVAWRWIFAPSTGVNEILRSLGIENPPGLDHGHHHPGSAERPLRNRLPEGPARHPGGAAAHHLRRRLAACWLRHGHVPCRPGFHP